MAFDITTFVPISARGANPPHQYSYATTDSLATVSADGYFDDLKFQVFVSDIFYVHINDVPTRYYVTAVTPNVTLGLVPSNIKTTTRITASTYQILNSDEDLFLNTDSNAIAATLPATPDEGQHLRIINSGSSENDVTITIQSVVETIRDNEVVILTYNATDGWF